MQAMFSKFTSGCRRARNSALSTLLLVAALAIGVGISPKADAKPSEAARLWLADVQSAEEMIGAAIATTDVDELKKQSYALLKLQGRILTDLASLEPGLRMACVIAAQALNNVLLDLKLPPARAAVAAKADAADYRDRMTQCEKGLGRKPGPRHLPF